MFNSSENENFTTSSSLSFIVFSAIGGILFVLACVMPWQPKTWLNTPIMGYFVTAIWVYLFGTISGLCASTIGIYLLAAHLHYGTFFFGWIIGNFVAVTDAGIILMMARAMISVCREDKLSVKALFFSIFLLGIIISTFYGIGFFKSFTDWIFGLAPFARSFKIGLRFSVSILFLFFCSVPFAICLEQIFAYFVPGNWLIRFRTDFLQ